MRFMSYCWDGITVWRIEGCYSISCLVNSRDTNTIGCKLSNWTVNQNSKDLGFILLLQTVVNVSLLCIFDRLCYLNGMLPLQRRMCFLVEQIILSYKELNLISCTNIIVAAKKAQYQTVACTFDHNGVSFTHYYIAVAQRNHCQPILRMLCMDVRLRPCLQSFFATVLHISVAQASDITALYIGSF